MEKDLGKIQKNDTTDIVVRIDDFGGKVGLTIREYITGERYTGFTKQGTRIPAEKIPEFKEMINNIKDEDLVLSEGAGESSKDTGAAGTQEKEQQKLPEDSEADSDRNETEEIEEETI